MPSTTSTTTSNTQQQQSKTLLQQQQQAASTTTTVHNDIPISANGNNNNTNDEEVVPHFKRFEDMPLHYDLVRGIYSYGFETPSDIQQTAIVPISKGGDVIAQASAGTGKTGAFAIGTLARINPRLLRTQILMLAPTRELADQTHQVTLGIGARIFAPLLDAGAEPVALISSNTRLQDNVALLSKTPTTGNAQIVVGTPGRVLQLFERGVLRPEHLLTMVIDEADELFSQGFQEQISKICRYLPRQIQIVLVSATLPDEVSSLVDRLMRDPTRILLKPKEVPVDAIRQFRIDDLNTVDDKMMVLFDLYERISIAQSIIFVNSRRKAEYIAKEMNRNHFAVALTHGDLSRGEREAVMDRFKKGEARVLVTTDLVGRGIDVVQVNLVINFELPIVLEKYIHRVGRCGRFGKKGVAVNLISRVEDLPLMKEIESQFGIVTTEFPMDFEKYLS